MSLGGYLMRLSPGQDVQLLPKHSATWWSATGSKHAVSSPPSSQFGSNDAITQFSSRSLFGRSHLSAFIDDKKDGVPHTLPQKAFRLMSSPAPAAKLCGPYCKKQWVFFRWKERPGAPAGEEQRLAVEKGGLTRGGKMERKRGQVGRSRWLQSIQLKRFEQCG